MKMKKSQLKEAVKAVVRECLNERCGGGKASRMFKHVEDSEKEQGKSTKVAKKIAGATVNKRLKEGQVGVGANVVTNEIPEEGMGADAKMTAIEDVIKFVIKRAPAIAHDAHKIAKVAAELFAHQSGWGAPDPEHLLPIVQKHMTSGSSGPADECGGMEEAGLTSETGGEGYDEKEEIMLIKVMALIAQKLEAMHAGQPGAEEVPTAIGGTGEEEPSAPPFGGGEEEPEEPSDEPSAPPFGGGEKEPAEPEHEEEPKDEKPEKSEKPEKKKKEPPIKEVSAKTQTQGYRVAPNPSTLTQKTDDEKLKPRDPRLTETSLTKAGKKAVSYKTQGASYKVAPNPSCRVKNDDKDRREPGDPELTETAKVKENHKVQARSFKTVKDQDNDPNTMRDPEVPQA